VQIDQDIAQLTAQRGLETRERLVEQKDLRLAHQGPTQGHTLALPTGELPRTTVEQRFEPQSHRGLLHPTGDLRGRGAPHLEPEGEVLRTVR